MKSGVLIICDFLILVTLCLVIGRSGDGGVYLTSLMCLYVLMRSTLSFLNGADVDWRYLNPVDDDPCIVLFVVCC